MRLALRTILTARWMLPSAISLFVLALIARDNPLAWAFDVEQWDVLFLLLLILLWAGVSWWMVWDDTRYARFMARTAWRPGLLPVAIVVGSLFLLDYCSALLNTVGLLVIQHVFTLSSLGVISLIVLMLVCSSDTPRRIWQNLAVCLVFTAIGLLGIEGIFRGFLVQSLIPRNDREFQVQVASNWLRAIAPAKPAGTFRIIGLADSFGVAGGHQNYHYVLEQLLRQEHPQTEVVNLSVGAYELPDEYELFTRFGPRYLPDIVLHGFFVGNDFWVPQGLPFAFRGVSLRLPSGLAGWRPQNFFVRNWLKNYATVLLDTARKQEQTAQTQPVGGLAHENFLRIEQKRMTICLTSIRADDPMWGQVTAQLDQIVAAVQAAGAMYVMVIHPDQFQVEAPLLEEIGQRFQLRPAAYDLQQPQRFLLNYCRTRNLPCLDLLPIFREHGRQGGLFLLDDTHYNEQGNLLAAQEIARLLATIARERN